MRDIPRVFVLLPLQQWMRMIKPTSCTFHSTYWESRASTCFERYLLNLRRSCTNDTLHISCVCQLAVARLQFHWVSLQWNGNRATANWNTQAIYKVSFVYHLLRMSTIAVSPSFTAVKLQSCHSWHTQAIYKVPFVQHLLRMTSKHIEALDSQSWMKSASRWFRHTDRVWCTVSKTLG
jgi:hypothetical protein